MATATIHELGANRWVVPHGHSRLFVIALGVKSIETRSWSTSYRGPLAIHAGAKRPRNVWAQERPDVYDPVAMDRYVYDPVAMDRYLNISEDGHGSGSFLYEWNGPLGAVVATCTLVDVVPIYGPFGDCEGVPCIRVGGPWDGEKPGRAHHHDGTQFGYRDVTDQLPYGDFTPGRYAWLLSDVVALPEPIPAKGRQGLWEWAA